MDIALVCPHRLSCDRESEAKSRPIGAASIAKSLKQRALTVWNAAALVFDLDDQALFFGTSPQRHRPVGGRVLERVEQQVHDLSLIHISEPTRLLSISY